MIGLHGGERSDAASLDHPITVGCALISASHWAEKVKANYRDNPAEIGELA
ncbi:MAG TPA: hypothetical protein VF503_11615 [Sphingobium sp.]|uniref:hypothetical protein n=1 Tax=Sphingobium sp. TaxID=1912891 RepID=UPI002ED1FB93